MKNEFVLAVNEITDARALPREVILDALRTALISAYRRDVSVSSGQGVDATVDMTNGTVTLLVEKETVESVQDTRTEVKLSEARLVDPEVLLGDTLLVPVDDMTGKFGRIAAQTAKQVILQKIREAERESLYEEYVEREGDLISGTVQSITPQGVTISLGRAEALLPRTHMMPGEHYRPHDKVRTFLLEVKKGNRGPQIIVSRSHRNMLRRLLEYEVPEIYNGQVEIKNIAREAGYRSKVAVSALQEGVDPVGACVGMRGIRIQNIVRELNEEKIDVIEWNQDAGIFITKALSPARVTGVFLDEFADSGRGGMGTATVIVPDDQLSLAIGREGQNARLAAKLTGWRIDIKSVTESAANAVAETENAILVAVHEKNTELAEEVQRIMAKREAGRPIMPEEFQTIAQYARLAENALLDERRAVNKKHQEYLQTIRETLPAQAFETDVSELDLPGNYNRLLGSRFESVGDVMLYLIVDEERVDRALRRLQENEALERVKWAIEEIVILDPVVEDEPAAEVAVVEEVAPVEEETPAAETEPEPVPEPVDEDEEVLPAVVEPELEEEEVAPVLPTPAAEPVPAPAAPAPSYFEEEEFPEVSAEKKKKQAKSRRRQLVFDEDAGQVVAKRKRKDSRKRSTYFDEIDELDKEF